MRKEASDGGSAQAVPDSSSSGEVSGDAAALLAAAGMSANSLTFNPFLLSSMAPGLFYPSMFLPPGLGGLSLAGFPSTSLSDLQNAMTGALGAAAGAGAAAAAAGGAAAGGEEAKEQEAEEEQRLKGEKEEQEEEGSDSAESQEKTAKLSALEEEEDSPKEGGGGGGDKEGEEEEEEKSD